MSLTIFQVYSPDGFSIKGCKTFSSMDEAKQEFSQWAKRFVAQGYYSSNSERIPLNKLERSCLFKELDKSKCSAIDIVFYQDIISSKV